jgi:hypothetical protein
MPTVLDALRRLLLGDEAADSLNWRSIFWSRELQRDFGVATITRARQLKLIPKRTEKN